MEILDINKEIKEEKKINQEKKLSKSVLNIIRTTMRNNIELTSIADNKANVLLSLNALMLTFMVPFLLPYLDIIAEYNLVYPLTLLVLTSLATIYMSASVLKPAKFFINQTELEKGRYVSPFFFGNFYRMSKDEFTDYVRNAVSDKNLVKRHVTEDLHFIGGMLGKKMSMMRVAFNVFLIGFTSAILLALVLMIVYS